MKLHLLNRSSSNESSFTVTRNRHPYFLKIWHYHPELELVLIEKSSGTRFIGDSIQKFEAGEVVLLGKNLPHMWLNDEVYIKSGNLIAEAIAIHFNEDFFGASFFERPEFAKISKLIKRADRGLKFNKVDEDLKNMIRKLLKKDSFSRAIALLEILHRLASHKNHESLSSLGYINSFVAEENDRLHKIHEYVFNNFKKVINANEVAQEIGMNASAFSRFFKKNHRKTFTKYLNEIRVGYACKLLLESQSKITAIAYESGFNNISNFNRQFKACKQMTPKEYIKYHRTI
ncbi:AraC family transcriptional regulator [Allomuricauda sp. SCSIO 65647]|uniref:AraC family transcriptional regulator n=1 Tax=Allomuricauda sp. SCSIO 65647 TaxID=2908843 RepID=UPI001F224D49|nr:AraC family transcriptional regulator [Muricauda sp. SCSIO 65647]UJH68774.1 AraC family transcriptional regulator [Muricauda sp. SCSIO 65647]